MTLPWTEKHKPKKLRDFLGDERALILLENFIKNYEKSKKKAVLLFGPSGCGKTTIAYLMASHFNYEIFELNASDFRDKESLNLKLKNALQQNSLFSKGKIILIEELEGISGTEDRGGISALSSLIKESKYPIIITSNFLSSPNEEYWDPKFNAVKQQSLLVKMKKISTNNIVKILKNIAKKESVNVNDDFLAQLAIKSDGDLRAAINDFQVLATAKMLRKEDLKSIDYRDRSSTIKDALIRILKQNTFENSLRAFENTDIELDDKFLWLDENLPLEYDFRELANAYDVLSRADVFRGRIIKRQTWHFLASIEALITAGISISKEKRKNNPVEYKQPSRKLKTWILKNQNLRRSSIANKLSKKTRTSFKEAYYYAPLLKIMFKNKNFAKEISDFLELEREEVEWLVK
jgi:replication factor C large subunit